MIYTYKYSSKTFFLCILYILSYITFLYKLFYLILNISVRYRDCDVFRELLQIFFVYFICVVDIEGNAIVIYVIVIM